VVLGVYLVGRGGILDLTGGQGESGSRSGLDWRASPRLPPRALPSPTGLLDPFGPSPGRQDRWQVVLLLRVSANSDPAALGDARRKVRDAIMRAGLRADAVEAMEVAVGEVLSNVHWHAYKGGIGPISVAVSRYPNHVSVLMVDDGHAMVAPVVPRMLPSRASVGGRGLYLVGCFADSVRIRVNRAGYGLTVRLTKRLRSTETLIDSGRVA
jgi:anti-sigma regulatory factor (Ser/Thr protein kinase)